MEDHYDKKYLNNSSNSMDLLRQFLKTIMVAIVVVPIIGYFIFLESAGNLQVDCYCCCCFSREELEDYYDDIDKCSNYCHFHLLQDRRCCT